uniref:Odorant binding protein 1 n=1 Tax=Subpsaltria yangi TaxID=1195109 RepID=A0A385IUN6_9HEMI|nr:odorant binding protein 1 [Subpsaltria yangi]
MSSCVPVLVAAVVSVFCLWVAAEQDMLSVFNKCKLQTKATESDIETFKKQEIPSSTTGKCLLACMFNDSGLMSNGKYDVQGAHNLARQVYQTSPEKMEKAKQVVDTCAKEVNSFQGDECDLAAQVATCTMKTSATVGLA